jgi:DNA-binding LytR/AlgR family response regulator
MYERRANGTDDRADPTLETLRRRREPPPRPRTLGAKRATPSGVLIGERERRLYLLAPGELDYIESRGNYVEFHADQLVFISRDSIKRLSRVLAASGYLRIQRTLLLNIESIVYAQRAGHGTYAFTLSSGARLRSGASYREEILRSLPLTRARRFGGS